MLMRERMTGRSGKWFQERPPATSGYFFLPASCFGGHGGAFFLIGAGGLGVFLSGLLLVGFRGFVAHNFYLGSAVDSPAA